MSVQVSDEWSVYAGEQFAGRIIEHSPMSCSLIYHEQWQHDGYAFSPSLPLDDLFSDGDVSCFLRNLLPEGNGLETLLISQQVSRLDCFNRDIV